MLPETRIDDRSRPLALRDLLRRRISDGAYPPGRRLPGERQLAETFNVCRWTVNEAVGLLEKEGVLERFPRRGVYVRETPSPRGICRKLVFIMPDEPIGEATQGFVRWNRFLEFNSGLTEGARRNDLELSLLPTGRVLSLNRESGILAAVIVSTEGFETDGSDNKYLRHLQKNRIPVILIGPEVPLAGISCIRYDRETACRRVADFIATRDLRSMVFLQSTEDNNRCVKIRQYLADNGSPLSSWQDIVLPGTINSAIEVLRETLSTDKSKLPDLFYCDRMIYPLVLLRVAAERDWRLGRDLHMVAFTCRTAIEHISPELSYLRIPYYEMGLEACELALRLNNNPDQVEFIELKGEMIVGASDLSIGIK